MGLLSHLKVTNDIEQQEDTLGGSRGLPESDLYDMVVEMAYLGESKGGAASVTLWLKSPQGSHRETVYITSGKAKGQKNFYTTQDGSKKLLPGFALINDLTRLTIDKEIAELEPEEKVVNIYNYELKKEVPTPVQVLTELLGAEVKLGIVKSIVDKNVKNDAGVYVPSGETREATEIDKVFHQETGLTVVEAEAGMEEGAFYLKWQEANKGKIRDKLTKKEGAKTVGTTASEPTAAKKLNFGKK